MHHEPAAERSQMAAADARGDAPANESRALAQPEAQHNELALIGSVDDLSVALARTSLRVADTAASGFFKFLLLYALLCVYMLSELGRLPRCTDALKARNQCAYPWAHVGDDANVDVVIFGSTSGDPEGATFIEYQENATRQGSVSYTVPIPLEVRTRGAPYTAHLYIRPSGLGLPWNDSRAGHHVASVQLTTLRRVTAPEERPRKLLEGAKEEEDVFRPLAGTTANHWRFGSWALVLRLLKVGGGDGALTAQAAFEDGLPTMGARLDTRLVRGRYSYMPVAYADETLALAGHARVLSRDPDHADPKLVLKVAANGPVEFGLRATVASQLFGMVTAMLPEGEVDELRWQLSDSRVTRFVVQQAVGMLHIFMDYLAFSEDVGFYVGRETFHGVSASSLVWAFVRDVILMLYLREARAGKIVLFGLYLSILKAFFKIQRVLKPRLVLRPGALLWYPAIACVPLKAPKAKATAAYDREATRHLYLGTWPIFVGLSIYTLVHDVHRSYYGWLVSSLADLVYYFGFVMMTPQLWINYKLRSVAHLPMKVFMYKIFNTFIDDAFAWIVDMPMKHRLMTLRDDVVFLVFLYQWWAYRVDKTRPNEYGRAYEGGAPTVAEEEDPDRPVG